MEPMGAGGPVKREGEGGAALIHVMSHHHSSSMCAVDV